MIRRHPLRYERKFALPLEGIEVSACLREHPACFREAHPPRFVNSLYLDSHALDQYRDVLDGVGDREKLRIRWYGDLHGRGSATLERKRRMGEVLLKEELGTGPWALEKDADTAAVQRLLAGSPQMRMATGRLGPVLLVRYRRQYEVSADGRFRATVDTGLSWCPWRHGFPLAPLGPGAPATVLEFKHAPDDEPDFRAMGSPFGSRLTRMSKYACGTSLSLD